MAAQSIDDQRREVERIGDELDRLHVKADTLADKLQAMIGTDDAAGRIAWKVTADTLIYSAKRLPEIADDVMSVDNAMKWGFGWDAGPFEVWDAIGVPESVERMLAEGRVVPDWVQQMLASGRTSFYARDEQGHPNLAAITGGVSAVEKPAGVLLLRDLRVQGGIVQRNLSASLLDLGEGVLNLQFHSKMNALDELIIELYGVALDKLDAGEFEALVVGNQDGRVFCAGANVLMILMNAMQKDWDAIDRGLPVVAAPHGMTLGGGCEVAMQCAATQAGAELYCGLVEVGVGLIPGAGGCKELLVRYLGDVPQDIDYDPTPFVAKAFERIGLAQVSTSAEEARGMGYLRPTDRVTMNPSRLVADARELASGLAASGYRAPRPRTVKVPGVAGRAAVELFLYSMHEGGFATDHDVTVGKKLAHVMTGGDVPAGTVRTEQDLLDLEREAFLSLCGMEASQARMQHMLQTGKPLRN